MFCEIPWFHQSSYWRSGFYRAPRYRQPHRIHSYWSCRVNPGIGYAQAQWGLTIQGFKGPNEEQDRDTLEVCVWLCPKTISKSPVLQRLIVWPVSLSTHQSKRWYHFFILLPVNNSLWWKQFPHECTTFVVGCRVNNVFLLFWPCQTWVPCHGDIRQKYAELPSTIQGYITIYHAVIYFYHGALSER